MRLLRFVVLLTLAFGCSNPSVKHDEEGHMDTMRRERPVLNSDSARIITLPTPMQIPALLKTTQAHYSKDLLFPLQTPEKPFFKTNILFGIYMLDLAYASSFSDRQTALLYFKKCRSLTFDMGMGVNIDDQLVHRFENNLDRPDSLGRIILEMYDTGHDYFRQNDKEGIGLLIVMGCLFEGLHFGFKQVRDHDLILFFHLLSQQKQYLSNLIYALDAYEIPAEIQNEYTLLLQCNGLFQQLNAPSAYELKTGAASLEDVNKQVLSDIEEVVDQFRESAAI